MLPPLGNLPRVLQADLSHLCASAAFESVKALGPLCHHSLSISIWSGERFGFQNFLVNFINVLQAPSLGLVLSDYGMNEQMNE